MRIAIFADIHGKILLPFKLVNLYQKETEKKVDLILQCGDIGAFPYLERLDKATIKHAQNDRDELGFHDDFVAENEAIHEFLTELDLQMICVRGNHEDHEFLNELEIAHFLHPRFPIDIYQKVLVCKSGIKQELKIGDETLTFVGIGRIGDRKGRKHQKFIQDYEKREIDKLIKSNEDFDLLITHDKSSSSERGYGTEEIRQVLDNVIFQYHFYGHTGEPFSIEPDDNGFTKSCKIKELEFTQSGNLPEKCMVILEKSLEGEFTLETVSKELTKQLTKHNWKY
ncbi:MAG: metallophosphoesterase [Bacteroidota bacterium]